MNPRMQHPDWETILTHVESGDDPAVVKHCEGCSRCAGTVEALRGLLSSLAASRLPAVPSGLVEATLTSLRNGLAESGAASGSRGLGAELRELVARVGRPLRELAATLVADSLKPSAALRSGSAAGTRNLMYEAEGCSVMLQLDTEPTGARALRGQVLPAGGDALPADAAALAPTAGALALSEHGEFVLSHLDPETREILIVFDDRLIRIDLPD